MFSFFKKNKNKEKEIDQAFAKVEQELSEIEDWSDPKKLEHYILDSCEQIISTTKGIEAEKAEYRVLTNYLEDIRTLSELPIEQHAELTECASKIIELNKARTNYQKSTFQLTDAQFILIEEEENTMVDTIVRLQDNERYQSSVKREMQNLEAQKSEAEYDRDQVNRSNKLMRRLSVALMVVFVSLMLLSYVLATMTDYDTQTFTTVVFALTALMILIIFLTLNRNTRIKKKSIRKINDSISVLNVVRMKYANVTNAISYVQDKYDVRTAAELNYIWEQYTQAVKERERYVKNNDDLEFFTGRLMRLLGKIELYDRKIWLSQVEALVNKQEMAEVRHVLIERRQKLRSRIEADTRAVMSERNEIDKLMQEHHFYMPEIQQIINSVDRLCGLNEIAAKGSTAQ